MPVEAKLPFAPFRARHIGGAEEQASESRFDLGRHVWSTARGADALLGTRDVRRLHELPGGSTGQRLQVRVESLSADCALVPLSSRMRRTTSPNTAISD